MNPHRPFWGLLHRRECVVPTWRGLLLVTLFGVGLMVMAVSTVHSFLEVTNPVSADVLVVEGWVPDYVLEKAKIEFERHHYRRLYVTGSPIEMGMNLSEYSTFAERGAAILVRMGIKTNVIEAVPTRAVWRDRTYSAGLAVKNRLDQQATSEMAINVLTMGVHARRSQLLFQRAFGRGVRVGIIAIENRDYDPKHWWKFSEGVRAVVDEFVAYIYALVFFPIAEP